MLMILLFLFIKTAGILHKQKGGAFRGTDMGMPCM
jgi:hypothetical protein